jgi:hypothetical protein
MQTVKPSSSFAVAGIYAIQRETYKKFADGQRIAITGPLRRAGDVHP